MHPQRSIIDDCHSIINEQVSPNRLNSYERGRKQALDNLRNQQSYGRAMGGMADIGLAINPMTLMFNPLDRLRTFGRGLGKVATGAGNAVANALWRPSTSQQVKDERGRYFTSGQMEADRMKRKAAGVQGVVNRADQMRQQSLDNIDATIRNSEKLNAARAETHRRNMEMKQKMHQRRMDNTAKQMGITRQELDQAITPEGRAQTRANVAAGDQRLANSMFDRGSLEADLARIRQPARQQQVGEIGNSTGVYVRGTPAERQRLATQAGIGANSSTSTLEREAAKTRLNNRELGGASLMPGGVPRDRQGNEVANTIANREAEMRSRVALPGQTRTATGERAATNERDISRRMYRDDTKEYARIQREEERRKKEKEENSVDAQVKRFENASQSEKEAMIRKLNASAGNPTPPR